LLTQWVQVRNLVVGQGGVPAVVGAQLELQVGDFNNDGYPELILGYIDHKSGQLRLFQWDLRIEDTRVWPAGMVKPNRADLSPCGCFDSESVLRHLFALAIPITVPDAPTYDLAAPPTASSTRVDSPGFSYALAVGDIGLGFDVVRHPDDDDGDDDEEGYFVNACRGETRGCSWWRRGSQASTRWHGACSNRRAPGWPWRAI
jgi:hypothetical protein